MTKPLEETSHVVTASDAGARFDKIVATVAGVSRGVAARLIADGRATLRGRSAKGNSRVVVDDVVLVLTTQQKLVGVPMSIDIAYRDEHVLVVNKVPGRVVHPGAGHSGDTLVNGLVYQYPELESLGEERRWGLVHRLDKDTSGLLMVGLDETTFDELREQLAARKIERRYTALVHGSLAVSTGTIEASIGRDPRAPTKMAIVQGGRFARTHYRTIERWADHVLLQVTLDTGRTHQIRVHMQSIGHPIVNDPVYGNQLVSVADPGRVWLHATSLAFIHPVTHKEIRVQAPLPRDLAESLETLRRR
ncbi:MAG: RluA family pseudouridine synthase [Acidobacteria bacterium]|nr:RluA family pseudouridine synthase [Acidobacteriota bacterium]